MGTVQIHSNKQLYIQHRRLFAVQISPENLPRIFNMFREWAIRYDVPRSQEKKPATFTMQKNATEAAIVGYELEYLVWGPAVPVHVVKSDDFEVIYQIMEELE